MLDRLEIACRRFERIDPAGANRSMEIARWLEMDVGAIVEELWERPAFRQHARWSLDHLQAGAATPERQLVEDVDRGLGRWAEELASIARQPAILDALRNPKGGKPSSGKKDAGPPVPEAGHGCHDLAEVEIIARRPWRDLVAIEDYFFPTRDLNLLDRKAALGCDNERLQVGEFLPVINPQLRPLGDFVSRCLCMRIEYWHGILRRFAVRCQAAGNQSGSRDQDLWMAAQTAQKHVSEASESVQHDCLSGAAAKAGNACATLVQIYLAYRPLADWSWLGLPADAARVCRFYRDQVERRGDVAIGDQVASALLQVASLYRQEADAEEVIASKCRFHSLVIVAGRGRREVYWQAQQLEVDWFSQNAPWEMLVTLAEMARSGQGTDSWDGKSIRSLKDRRSRLKALLPADLNGRIRPAGQGTYRLDIDPQEFCVLGFTADDRLSELADNGPISSALG